MTHVIKKDLLSSTIKAYHAFMRLLFLFISLVIGFLWSIQPGSAAEYGLFDRYINQDSEPLRAKKLQHFKDVGFDINSYKSKDNPHIRSNTLERILLLRLDETFSEHYTPRQYKDLVSVLLKSRCPVPLDTVQKIIHYYKPDQHDKGYLEPLQLCLRNQRLGLSFRKPKQGNKSWEMKDLEEYLRHVNMSIRRSAKNEPHDFLFQNTLLMDLCEKGLFDDALYLLNAGMPYDTQRHYKLKTEKLPEFPTNFSVREKGMDGMENYKMSMKKVLDPKRFRTALIIACRTPYGDQKKRDKFLLEVLKKAKKLKYGRYFFLNAIDPEDEMTALDYACCNDVDSSVIRQMVDLDMEGAAYYQDSSSVKSPSDYAEDNKRDDLKSILSRYSRRYVNSEPKTGNNL